MSTPLHIYKPQIDSLFRFDFVCLLVLGKFRFFCCSFRYSNHGLGIVLHLLCLMHIESEQFENSFPSGKIYSLQSNQTYFMRNSCLMICCFKMQQKDITIDRKRTAEHSACTFIHRWSMIE